MKKSVFTVPNSRYWVVRIVSEDHGDYGIVLDPRRGDEPMPWSSGCRRCRDGKHERPDNVSQAVAGLCSRTGETYLAPRGEITVTLARDHGGAVVGGVVGTRLGPRRFRLTDGMVRFEGERLQSARFRRLVGLLLSERALAEGEEHAMGEYLRRAERHAEEESEVQEMPQPGRMEDSLGRRPRGHAHVRPAQGHSTERTVLRRQRD